MTPKRNYDRQRVFISGGTSGIGRAAGIRFAQLGADVLAFSIDAPAVRAEAEAAFKAAAPRSEQLFASLPLDVTDRDAVLATLKDAIADFGGPQVLINCAGAGGATRFEEESFARFDKLMQLNVYGLRHVIEACLPAMKQTGGTIVNVASMAGLMGNYGYTTYSASKFAAVGFTQALRSELKPYGIGVSVLCPVQVDTPMLRHTDTFKPPETKAINDKAGLMSAEAVVEGMLQGMDRNRALIIPGFKGRFVNAVNRWFPGLRESMTERIIEKARVKNEASE